ncbi:hypothetical protein N752_03830 [Desulforamulus aquiferis]|nr:hypothetical protein N752_03830 [Desulforamulus aquiferis]
MPRKWRYFGFLAMPLIISLSLLLYLASGMSFASEDVVLPGISIMDVELSNLNQDQAVERVKQLEESYQKTIKVAYQNSNWDLPLNTIGLKLDCEKEVQRAMDIGALEAFGRNLLSGDKPIGELDWSPLYKSTPTYWKKLFQKLQNQSSCHPGTRA